MPVYESNGFVANGGHVPRAVAGEYVSNGGVIPRGDVGYGSEIPVPVESPYGHQYVMDGCKDMLSSQNWSMYKQSLDHEAAVLEQYGRQICGNMVNSVDPSQLMYSKQSLGRGNNVLYSSMREKMRALEQREAISSAALMKRTRYLDSYGCDSRIISDKGLNGVMGKTYQLGRTKKSLSGSPLHNIGERNYELNVPLQTERACDNGGRSMTGYDPVLMQTLFNSVDVRGQIFLMAKDQHGCRFLQKKFDEGSFDDVQLIFDEIIDHVVELMINPFGNYLIQKLLDVCSEEQRMKIVHMVTKNRGELVKISLNSHGTRVVQKLIESLKTRKQISLVIIALEPGFLDLMRDLNGNHVVQRCLHCLNSEDNKNELVYCLAVIKSTDFNIIGRKSSIC